MSSWLALEYELSTPGTANTTAGQARLTNRSTDWKQSVAIAHAQGQNSLKKDSEWRAQPVRTDLWPQSLLLFELELTDDVGTRLAREGLTGSE